MRLFALILLVLGGLITDLSANALVYLKVSTPSVCELQFSLTKSDKERITYRITLDSKKGDAYFPVDIEEPQFVDFQYNKTQFKLFIEPNNDIIAYFDAQNLLKTLRFEGVGAENNNCLAQFQRLFRYEKQHVWKAAYLSPLIDEVTEKRAKQSDVTTYQSIVKGEKESEIQFLDSWQHQIHKKVYSYLWKDATYMHDTKLYAYILAFDFLDKDELKQIHSKFFSTHTFNYTDYDRNDTEVFTNALKAFVHSELVLAKNEPTENAIYEVIGKRLGDYDKFNLQKKLILEIFYKTSSTTLAQQKFELYAKECPFKELVKDIQFTLEGHLNTFIKEHAPNVQYETAEGVVANLSDYKGKVVYISYWASWCKPCLEGFQKYSDLRSKLQAEGVILLNLNIDDDPAKYRNTLSHITLAGINAQPIDMTKVKQQYNLYSIPAYYIVDKKGNLAILPNKEGRDIVHEFRRLMME
jgi:thiol-disulfide isomerase/thioredoxin